MRLRARLLEPRVRMTFLTSIWCVHARRLSAAWVLASCMAAHEVVCAQPGPNQDAVKCETKMIIVVRRMQKLTNSCRPHALARPSIDQISAVWRSRRAKSIARATCGRAAVPPSRLPIGHAALVGRRRAAGVGAPGYLPGADPAAGGAADAVAHQPSRPYHYPEIPRALCARSLCARLPRPGGWAWHHRAGLLGARRHRRHLHLHAACARPACLRACALCLSYPMDRCKDQPAGLLHNRECANTWLRLTELFQTLNRIWCAAAAVWHAACASGYL